MPYKKSNKKSTKPKRKSIKPRKKYNKKRTYYTFRGGGWENLGCVDKNDAMMLDELPENESEIVTIPFPTKPDKKHCFSVDSIYDYWQSRASDGKELNHPISREELTESQLTNIWNKISSARPNLQRPRPENVDVIHAWDEEGNQVQHRFRRRERRGRPDFMEPRQRRQGFISDELQALLDSDDESDNENVELDVPPPRQLQRQDDITFSDDEETETDDDLALMNRIGDDDEDEEELARRLDDVGFELEIENNNADDEDSQRTISENLEGGRRKKRKTKSKKKSKKGLKKRSKKKSSKKKKRGRPKKAGGLPNILKSKARKEKEAAEKKKKEKEAKKAAQKKALEKYKEEYVYIGQKPI